MEIGETPGFLLHITAAPTAAFQENFFYTSQFYLSFSPQEGIPKVKELVTYSVGIYFSDF